MRQDQEKKKEKKEVCWDKECIKNKKEIKKMLTDKE